MSTIFVKCIKLTSFTHLIFSTTESMRGKGGTHFYCRSAELLSKSDPIAYSCTYLSLL